ncbi:MAG: hypothetical protein WC809_00370 [Sinimarinibacterium sp.]
MRRDAALSSHAGPRRLHHWAIIVAAHLVVTPGVGWAHSAPERAVVFHGGIAASAGGYNLELVAADGKLELYVRDRQNRPIDPRDHAGTALVWSTGESISLDFSPGSAGVLEARGSFLQRAIRRVIVTVTAPDQEPVTAWFTGLGSGAD